VKHVLVLLLRAYRLIITPLYGQVCRYYPSCSAYALGAVEAHGAVRGSWLALRRLGRCHPWTPGGVDLIPPPGSYRWWGPVDDSVDDGAGSADDLPPTAAVPADQTQARQGA